MQPKEEMYNASRKRWGSTEASLKGITDGHVQTHAPDVINSFRFLQKLVAQHKLKPVYAIDCAAGVGRVSEHVLVNFFQNVDILERDEKFVEYCKKIFANNPKVKNFFCNPLETFKFTQKYDAIWVQWCLQYLKEDDVILFLKRCGDALTKNGAIIIKENIHTPLFADEKEGFEIRSAEIFENIFEKCNLEIICKDMLDGLPEDFMDVKVYALKTKRKKIFGLF